MCVSRPQSCSETSSSTSAPFARSSRIVAWTSSHRKKSSCLVVPSLGWTASSEGGRAFRDQWLMDTTGLVCDWPAVPVDFRYERKRYVP